MDGVRRKARTFAQNPVGALRSYWIKGLRRKATRPAVQWLARKRLARAGVLAAIDAFDQARPAEALPPDYADLAFLHSLARKKKPELIVEFGSGCSTVVFAHAIAANRRGELLSVEASAEWADSTKAALPAELARFCEVIHSPVVEAERFGRPGYSHSTLPDVCADFVYVDGPETTMERPVTFDIFDIRLAPECVIVVDGRYQEAELIAEQLRPARSHVPAAVFSYVFELRGSSRSVGSPAS